MSGMWFFSSFRISMKFYYISLFLLSSVKLTYPKANIEAQTGYVVIGKSVSISCVITRVGSQQDVTWSLGKNLFK